jgi:hypothetical protein
MDKNAKNWKKVLNAPDVNYLVRTPMKFSEHNANFKPLTPRASSFVQSSSNLSWFLNSKMTNDTGEPSLCNKSKILVNKMKKKGKFENCFIARLGSLDPKKR